MLTLAASLGCGDSYDLAPVDGRVTIDGQPVTDASVTFQPVASGRSAIAGPGSYGHTDAEGRFSLKTVRGQESGAVPGTHVVYISTGREDKSRPEEGITIGQRAPIEFLDGSVTFQVPAQGTEEANFDLANP